MGKGKDDKKWRLDEEEEDKLGEGLAAFHEGSKHKEDGLDLFIFHTARSLNPLPAQVSAPKTYKTHEFGFDDI